MLSDLLCADRVVAESNLSGQWSVDAEHRRQGLLPRCARGCAEEELVIPVPIPNTVQSKGFSSPTQNIYSRIAQSFFLLSNTKALIVSLEKKANWMYPARSDFPHCNEALSPRLRGVFFTVASAPPTGYAYV